MFLKLFLVMVLLSYLALMSLILGHRFFPSARSTPLLRKDTESEDTSELIVELENVGNDLSFYDFGMN